MEDAETPPPWDGAKGAGQKLLRPDLYKQVLVDQDIYARMPQLVAQQVEYSLTGDAADGGEASGQDSDGAFIAGIARAASPALAACLRASLGSFYESLAAGPGRPTAIEIGRVKACLRADGVPAGVGVFHKGMPVFFWLLLEQDWESILTPLLPENWLRTQSESVIDQIYAKLQTDEPTPPIRISLADLKASLRGADGLNAVVRIIDAPSAIRRSASPRSLAPHTNGTSNFVLSI